VGAAAGINVSGDVHLILSPDFVDTNVLYTGKSTIEGTAPGGQPVTTMYGGGVGGGGGASATMFILDGVASGTTWLGVMDETMGAAGVESTFSQQQGLTALTAMNVTLPVISLQTLQNIASLLPSVQTVGANSAQVILLLENSLGAAYPNVSLSSNPIGGEVAYDTGAGQYTDQDTMTSTGGTIIVFNSGLSGMQTLQLTYLSESTSTMMNQSVMVEGAPGFATIMTVMLQD
jgi:hypothetical protein